jgi:hypothetical protein
MKIAATLHCAEYRGEHSADVEIALDVTPATTLAELLELAAKSSYDCYHERLYRSDWVAVRIAQEPEKP